MALPPVPVGKGQQSPAKVPKPPKLPQEPLSQMPGAGLATGSLPPLLGAPQGARDGEGLPSPGNAFRSSPTSLSSRARVDFSRRDQDGAETGFTLEQCLFPLGKAKW